MEKKRRRTGHLGRNTKSLLLAGFGALVVGALFATGYVLMLPKIGTATRAEVEAALPPSLKAVDLPNPAGEARYARFLSLAASLTGGKRASEIAVPPDRKLVEIERLLDEGSLRVLDARSETLGMSFTTIKDGAKAIALATEAARKRGDRASCGRWAVLGVRYALALKGSGGVMIDALVHVAAEAIALRSAYVAETEGGIDDAGRERLLALLPPQDGRSPAMAAALRRDYRLYLLPTLLDPEAHRKELAYHGSFYDSEDVEALEEPELVGTFDPVATARLTGAVYGASIDDLGRPYRETLRTAEGIAQAATKGLPNRSGIPRPGHGMGDAWARLKHRTAMNIGRNTLGRAMAADSTATAFGAAAVREATNANLLRAVLLLRMGRPAAVPDPFDSENLRVDTRRKIVWSVGTNGKDDGGVIGVGGLYSTLDLGYPYGDRAYRPPAAPSFGGLGSGPGAGPPPGFPRGID